MPKKFDPEVKDRAVRMVLDRVEEAGSVTKAVALVSPKGDVGRETLRRWVSQHRVDAGLKDWPTSDGGHRPLSYVGGMQEISSIRYETLAGGSKRRSFG